MRPTFEAVMSTLSEVTIPVASIDVPSVSAVTKQLLFAKLIDEQSICISGLGC